MTHIMDQLIILSVRGVVLKDSTALLHGVGKWAGQCGVTEKEKREVQSCIKTDVIVFFVAAVVD